MADIFGSMVLFFFHLLLILFFCEEKQTKRLLGIQLNSVQSVFSCDYLVGSFISDIDFYCFFEGFIHLPCFSVFFRLRHVTSVCDSSLSADAY